MSETRLPVHGAVGCLIQGRDGKRYFRVYIGSDPETGYAPPRKDGDPPTEFKDYLIDGYVDPFIRIYDPDGHCEFVETDEGELRLDFSLRALGRES